MPINIPNIDSEYILDVGDQLRILLTGSLEGEFDIFIERAGNIFIPQVGSIQISGKLIEMQKELLLILLQRNKLEQIKQFH